jgi:hypothetical protein
MAKFQPSGRLTSWRVLTLALTALAFVPGGAHLFEMPRKMALSRDAYFIVQGIYAGWALFGVVIVAAIVANLILALWLRHQDRVAAALALCSAVLIGLSLVIFFTWTFPANQATENWTTIPENWERLRTEWEYSHACNALIVFGAVVATATAVARPLPPQIR